jgi:hypothetical protein
MNVKSNERFSVYSARTGKMYVVEPIKNSDTVKTVWGNINPATGKIEQVEAKEEGVRELSIITVENGFKNITILPPGESPHSYIEKLDQTYPNKGQYKYPPGSITRGPITTGSPYIMPPCTTSDTSKITSQTFRNLANPSIDDTVEELEAMKELLEKSLHPKPKVKIDE